MLESQGQAHLCTNAARKVPSVGGSPRDVQAGHSNLRANQTYIEENAEADARVVELVLKKGPAVSPAASSFLLMY
jgi:hypothetical protein